MSGEAACPRQARRRRVPTRIPEGGRDGCRCRLSGMPFVLWNLMSGPDVGPPARSGDT